MNRLFHLFKNSKHSKFYIPGLLVLALLQSFTIASLLIDKNNTPYEVNLVKIKTEKDSLDAFQLKNDLLSMEQTIRSIDGFLKDKNASDIQIENLAKDSLSNSIYLAKTANRYSQYLIDLEKKLQEVPLGIPSEGYISSNFGMRKNPIPPKKVILASIVPSKTDKKTEQDSLGNVSKITKTKILNKDEAPSEPDQMQFHKGIDVAVAYGSDVKCTAKGKVIFAGNKGGYGNCVIVQHGNGLSSLYAHLSEILVSANQEVKVGEVIAKSGNSGRSTGPHLHYEVHKNNTPVNPKLFLSL